MRDRRGHCKHIPGYAAAVYCVSTIYQQDEAPPHFANIVRTFVDEKFPARWIGRGSPYVKWPARSPDLTLPEFFLCGFVIEQFYSTPVHDLTDLQQRIYATLKSHHRYFITHGSRLNTGCAFPVPLMEAMLRFMEHKLKTIPSFHSLQHFV